MFKILFFFLRWFGNSLFQNDFKSIGQSFSNQINSYSSLMSSLNFNTQVKLSNGLDIPILGLGTYLSKGDDCYTSALIALQNGYTHLDTAQVYANEEQVGKAIIDSKVDRKKIFVTTKVWVANFENAYASVEESLKKLQLDYVDCILLHAPGVPGQDKDFKSMRKKAWLDLEKLYKEGKVKSIGISK
jgi:diketogulonate reductase-like aldo/keto reductase